MKKKIFNNKQGFTLVEVLISAGIMTTVIVGLMGVFVQCSTLAQMSGNFSNVWAQVQGKIEEIRNSNYDLITTNYPNGTTFNLTSPTGEAIIYLNTSTANLLQVQIVASWQNKYGRVVGEDKNINGVLDNGEDENNNGQLDSPLMVTTNIAKR